MEERDILKPGQLFAGKYRIERELGRGGMSAVYVARNEALQAEVALKVISPKLGSDPEAIARFAREGVACSRVRHRAIIQVFDAGEHQGTPWLAMELLPGESLFDRIKREGTLPPAEVARIAAEVASALVPVHGMGIIHRDLKPQNIFLDSGEDPPQPKILDFGIAKLGDEGMPALTQNGIAMGTPYYMAPEQARGERQLGPAVDLWALGVIMLEAVSGELPYERGGMATYMIEVASKPPRDVRRLAPAAPPRLQELIAWCLGERPHDRPPDARALKEALEALWQELAHDEATQRSGMTTELGLPAAIRASSIGPRRASDEEEAPTPYDLPGSTTDRDLEPPAVDPMTRTAQGVPFAPHGAAIERDPVSPVVDPTARTVQGIPGAPPGGATDRDPEPPAVDPAARTERAETPATPPVAEPVAQDSMGPGAVPSESPALSEPRIVVGKEKNRKKRGRGRLIPLVMAAGLLATCGAGAVGVGWVLVSGRQASQADPYAPDSAGPSEPLVSGPARTSSKAPSKAPSQSSSKASSTASSPAVTKRVPSGPRPVLIKSIPTGADILIGTSPTRRRTPATLTLEPGALIVVRKQGYRQSLRRLQSNEREVVLRLNKNSEPAWNDYRGKSPRSAQKGRR